MEQEQEEVVPAVDPCDALQGELKQQQERYMYLYADFENYKKRAVRERSELIKFGWESVARDLLGVLDNFERAIAHMPEGTFGDGITMIAAQFRQTLEKQGVQVVESLGKMFDPLFHDAITQESSDKPAGTVIAEHGRGYTLHGRLLRPARVIVSAGLEEKEQNNG